MIPQVCLYLLLLNKCHGYYQNSWNSERRHQRIPQDVMVDVVNNLALKLLAIHNEGNDNNIALSPYGALSVLVALKEGLRGGAAYEIQQTANIPSDTALVRVGLRDIHRHLRSYFIPEEGFLSGLTLSHDNVTLSREYEDILRFYGFDINSFNNAFYGELFTTTTETGTTEITTSTATNKMEADEITTTSKMETMESTAPTVEMTTPTETVKMITSTVPAKMETVEMTTSTETAKTDVVKMTTPTVTSKTETVEMTSIVAAKTDVVEMTTPTVTSKTETVEMTTLTVAAKTDVVKMTTPTVTSKTETVEMTTPTVAAKTDVVKMTTPTVTSKTETVEMTTPTVAAKTETVEVTTPTITTETPKAMTTVTVMPKAETTEMTTKEMESTERITRSEPTTTENIATTLTETKPTTTPQIFTSKMITFTEAATTTEMTSTTTDSDREISEINSTTEENSSETITDSSTNEIEGHTTEFANKPNDTSHRNTRSVVDYIIARYYDDHSITQRPPPYTAENDLYFLIDGKYKESNINYMTYDTVLPFHYVPHLNALALRFPLDSDKYYLLLLLPENAQNINKLICDLRLNGNLKYIINNLRLTHVKAIIPSFMLKGYVVLTPTLQKMGIRQVFEPRQADFSEMTPDRNIYVTNIEQAITVNIRNYVDPSTMDNNNRYLNRNNPVVFRADHPFLYFVIDSEIDVTLMMGKIINPLNSRIR